MNVCEWTTSIVYRLLYDQTVTNKRPGLCRAEKFWQGAKNDARVTKDVLNRTKARENKAASTGSHIKMDSFLQTKHAPGSRWGWWWREFS